MIEDMAKLDELFQTADKISSTDVTEFIKNKTDIEILDSVETLPVEIQEQIVEINEIRDDFLEMRNILRDSVKTGKSVLEKVALNMDVYEESMDAEMVASFSSLLKTVMDSMKVMSDSYSRLVDAQIKLKQKMSEFNNAGDVNITVNNGYTTSTLDLLKSLK